MYIAACQQYNGWLGRIHGYGKDQHASVPHRTGAKGGAARGRRAGTLLRRQHGGGAAPRLLRAKRHYKARVGLTLRRPEASWRAQE
jgi:hypothetical protein